MALSEIQILFRRCLHSRVSPREFKEILRQYKGRQKTRSKDLVSAYIKCCLNYCIEGDPLLQGYLQELLLSRSALLLDFILALALQFKSYFHVGGESLERVISTQTRTLTNLNIILASNPTYSIDRLRQCIVLTARWLAATARWAVNDQMKENLNAHNLTEVVGFLLVNLLNLNTLIRAPDIYKSAHQAMEECMGAFPSLSMELMNKLNMMQKPEQETSDSVDPSMAQMAALQFEQSIMETPIVATRSATIALLQHFLCTGSTIEDANIYTFLSTRHSGNHPVMFNDLVIASIDAMTKLPSNELYQHQCQVFMLNKLPFILPFISSSSFDGFSTEQNLVDAWNYINVTSPDSVPVGRRFLHICSYHHLIPVDTVTTLVGEDKSIIGLYSKDDLVAQVTANHTRGPRLVDEMLKNDGNAGMISQAIYEVMSNYCHMKETQHLKDMANAIVRRPTAINTIGMFVKPELFLTSLCTMLDEWKWDDIHGESQPVYDEFGSVFLLILAFKQRLRLSDSKLGIQQKGFLARYLSSKNTEVKMTDMTQKHLGDWIKSLYIDEGLSDELTSKCSAQEFYMLVPALLQQSAVAHTRGKLSYDMLKAGLEYLLEPFLLPSLLPAFGWLQHADSKTAQLVMQILVKTPEGDAKEIHQTILAMGGDQLHMDILPKSPFGMDPPEGELSQLASETYTSLTHFINNHGALELVHTIVPMLLQGDFHAMLDFMATMIVVSELRAPLQVERGKLAQYLKRGENLFAEALVHLDRRVELYANTLTTQDLRLEPFVPMNVANVNLDTVPEAFQQTEQNEDIDQVLNEAAAMGMDQLDNAGLDDIYELQANDFGLGSLDDLDLDSMFE